jgi:hypothetical protein
MFRGVLGAKKLASHHGMITKSDFAELDLPINRGINLIHPDVPGEWLGCSNEGHVLNRRSVDTEVLPVADGLERPSCANPRERPLLIGAVVARIPDDLRT